MLSFIKNLFNFNFKGEIKAAEEINTKLVEINKTENNIANILQVNVMNLLGHSSEQSIVQGLQNGNRNSELFGKEVQKLIGDNGISQEIIKNKLQDPEFLVTITDAAKIAYKESNVDKRKILADLIYKKISTSEDSESLTLTQAIEQWNF